MVDVPVRMPKMSMTMTEGEVVTWHVAVGDRVSRGDVVCEVLTDKVDMEVEAPAGGLVREILHADGVVVVGEPIAVIEADEGEDTVDLLADPEPVTPPRADLPSNTPRVSNGNPALETPAPPVDPDPEAPPRAGLPSDAPGVSGGNPALEAPARPALEAPTRPGPSGGRTPASVPVVPRARALAGELGVDVTRVVGTGPAGLVRVDDVRAARAGAPGRRDPRAAYARRMARSADVPQAVVRAEVPVADLAAARRGLSWTTLLLRALSAGLRAAPAARRMWDGGGLGPVPDEVAVSLAVAVPGGGVVGPVLVDVDLVDGVEGVRDLDTLVRRTVSQARRGRVAAAHARPATATLSNVGGLGLPEADGLVAPPQSVLLTVGALRPALQPPAPGQDPATPTWAPSLPLSLTVDHRVVDAATAAGVLDAVRALLTEPGRATGVPAATGTSGTSGVTAGGRAA